MPTGVTHREAGHPHDSRPHAVALAFCNPESLRRRERDDTLGVVVSRMVHARAHSVHRE